MARYMTEQRKALLAYLSEHADEPLTAAEVAEALEAQHISRSAVYRNIASLEQEGALRRLQKCGCREAVYRYSAAPACRGHIHLSCTRCGRVLHLDAGVTDRFIRSVESTEGFTVDCSETVLFGLCDHCR